MLGRGDCYKIKRYDYVINSHDGISVSENQYSTYHMIAKKHKKIFDEYWYNKLMLISDYYNDNISFNKIIKYTLSMRDFYPMRVYMTKIKGLFK